MNDLNGTLYRCDGDPGIDRGGVRVFLFLERSAVFAFLGKVRFVLAPVIYGAVLAFLMSPVYNWCYRLTVYTGKSGEPKARFKNEKLGAFFGSGNSCQPCIPFGCGRQPFQYDHPAAVLQYCRDHQYDAELQNV